MKTYDFKRAVITVTNILPLPYDNSSRESYTSIYNLKRDIAELRARGIPKDNPKVAAKELRIKELRSNITTVRKEAWQFNVYVKQYKKFIKTKYIFTIGLDSKKQFKEMIKEVTDNAIRTVRQQSKDELFLTKFGKFSISFLGNKKVGRVFQKEGEVLRLYIEKNIHSLYTDKLPTEPRKYIGIELEFCSPIKEQEFALKLFKSGIHKFAQLKKDGSLRPHEDKKEVGYELAILLEETNYKKRLKQITTLLTEIKAVAQDRRAGLHVHLDMRRRDKDLVYHNLVACQYALLSVVDPIRYNNEFCQVVNSRKFPTEFSGERSERYKTINAAAFYKYKTLEVRMHEGSVDYTQISSWVDLLVKIANYPKKMKDNVSKVSMLKKRMALDKKLSQYFIDRSCFWQVQNSERSRDLRYDIDHDHLNQVRNRIIADSPATLQWVNAQVAEMPLTRPTPSDSITSRTVPIAFPPLRGDIPITGNSRSTGMAGRTEFVTSQWQMASNEDEEN